MDSPKGEYPRRQELRAGIFTNTYTVYIYIHIYIYIYIHICRPQKSIISKTYTSLVEILKCPFRNNKNDPLRAKLPTLVSFREAQVCDKGTLRQSWRLLCAFEGAKVPLRQKLTTVVCFRVPSRGSFHPRILDLSGESNIYINKYIYI